MNTIDIETVGFDGDTLGNFYDFYVNNTFYLLAPPYYYAFYSTYLRRCLAAYDGWISGFHSAKAGLVPQRALQSIATGLNNMIFSHGIDFSGRDVDYKFALDWAKKVKLYKTLKKGHKYAIAGGTSLLKINRQGKELFVSTHRIDTFFVDTDANGNILSAKIFYDAIHNTNPSGLKEHYGICEERYFNEENKPCVKTSIYKSSETLQTDVSARLYSASQRINWEELPREVKQYVGKNYPSLIVDKEQYLPFPHSLGCFLMKFTDDIPQIPNTQFGQPIGDILFTENFQYDQMKYFEKNEVDLARARALVPEEFWNKDDPLQSDRAMSDRFYQKVSSLGSDVDKITPIQFLLRGGDIKSQKENIYKDIAFKLNISASSVATFLSEGAGARTATEIMSEKTKSDSFIDSQCNLNIPEINDMLAIIMRYYDHEPVEIILKSDNQSPFLETFKTLADGFAAGDVSPERFVKTVYKNLSQAEQQKEIEYLSATKEANDMAKQNIMPIN